MINIYLINAIALVFSVIFYKNTPVVLRVGNAKKINLSNAVFIGFWFILLSLEYGLRGNFTTDYIQYKIWFNSAHDSSLGNILRGENIEKGFLLLNYLVSRISSEYYVMTLTYGVLTIGAYIFAINRNIEVLWAPILVLIGSGVYYGGFNLSTQMLAGGLFAVAIKYIYERKPIKYTLLVLLAFSIHKSAIILLPVYFISYICRTGRNKKIMLGIILGGAVIMTAYSSQLAMYISTFIYGDTYQLSGTSVSGQGWGYVIKNVAMTIIILWFSKLFDMSNTKERVIFLGSILCCVLAIWSGQLALIQRMIYYFIIFPMLAFAHIMEKYRGNKHILSAIFVAFFTVMQIGWFSNTYFTYLYNG